MNWFRKKTKKTEEPDVYNQVYPVLKPGNWVGLQAGAISDMLLSKDETPILVEAYGYDLVTEFRFLTFKDAEKIDPEKLRLTAIKNINNYSVQLNAPDQFDGQVLTAFDQGFAAEKILDKKLMTQVALKLKAEELLVSIPRRGSLMISHLGLSQKHFELFVHLHQAAFEEDNGMAPITDYLITIKEGKLSGGIELSSLFE